MQWIFISSVGVFLLYTHIVNESGLIDLKTVKTIYRKSETKMVENNSIELTEQEAELYDRQIRLWGLDSQKR